jgi:CP family cyanate transporter-like MFS transporter
VFALFGTLAPWMARRVGLEIAMAMVSVGALGRAYLSHSMVVFGLLWVVSLGRMGFGNMLLPPAIKHYFPRHIGALTSVYLVLTTIGASVPSLVAVPAAGALGWRTSVGMWGLLGLIAACRGSV